uniref:Placental growth factor b n=1 Tax=Nothobranchius furzeri TaxID=105023 RepID=A0A8C6VW03_NOTFU
QGSVHGHVCFLFLLCLAIVVPVLPPQQLGHFHTLLMFQEVWGRSFCRTIEKLVEVVQEYPTEVEHIYSPSCVPLVRCAGCCGDEKLECHPTQTTNVTMQLLKIRPSKPGQEYVEMTFVEHLTCEYEKNAKNKTFQKVLVCDITNGKQRIESTHTCKRELLLVKEQLLSPSQISELLSL